MFCIRREQILLYLPRKEMVRLSALTQMAMGLIKIISLDM